jgi:hypothetical protein
MRLEVVFQTQEEAEAQYAIDFKGHLQRASEPIYRQNTRQRSTPTQRKDGRWAYYTHPLQDYTGMTVEAYNPENYA